MLTLADFSRAWAVCAALLIAFGMRLWRPSCIWPLQGCSMLLPSCPCCACPHLPSALPVFHFTGDSCSGASESQGEGNPGEFLGELLNLSKKRAGRGFHVLFNPCGERGRGWGVKKTSQVLGGGGYRLSGNTRMHQDSAAPQPVSYFQGWFSSPGGFVTAGPSPVGTRSLAGEHSPLDVVCPLVPLEL